MEKRKRSIKFLCIIGYLQSVVSSVNALPPAVEQPNDPGTNILPITPPKTADVTNSVFSLTASSEGTRSVNSDPNFASAEKMINNAINPQVSNEATKFIAADETPLAFRRFRAELSSSQSTNSNIGDGSKSVSSITTTQGNTDIDRATSTANNGRALGGFIATVASPPSQISSGVQFMPSAMRYAIRPPGVQFSTLDLTGLSSRPPILSYIPSASFSAPVAQSNSIRLLPKTFRTFYQNTPTSPILPFVGSNSGLSSLSFPPTPMEVPPISSFSSPIPIHQQQQRQQQISSVPTVTVSESPSVTFSSAPISTSVSPSIPSSQISYAPKPPLTSLTTVNMIPGPPKTVFQSPPPPQTTVTTFANSPGPSPQTMQLQPFRPLATVTASSDTIPPPSQTIQFQSPPQTTVTTFPNSPGPSPPAVQRRTFRPQTTLTAFANYPGPSPQAIQLQPIRPLATVTASSDTLPPPTHTVQFQSPPPPQTTITTFLNSPGPSPPAIQTLHPQATVTTFSNTPLPPPPTIQLQSSPPTAIETPVQASTVMTPQPPINIAPLSSMGVGPSSVPSFTSIPLYHTAVQAPGIAPLSFPLASGTQNIFGVGMSPPFVGQEGGFGTNFGSVGIGGGGAGGGEIMGTNSGTLPAAVSSISRSFNEFLSPIMSAFEVCLNVGTKDLSLTCQKYTSKISSE
ncbi:mucin-2-like [Ylistrum balloti]|uniref:mucin-2-like n=1 Tax=Ylistrum balloti TaxID=509963 RepID=UPI002905CEC2|nr:mucin-2-like [Ylistrum balloti]